jgi:hypothetical protein
MNQSLLKYEKNGLFSLLTIVDDVRTTIRQALRQAQGAAADMVFVPKLGFQM